LTDIVESIGTDTAVLRRGGGAPDSTSTFSEQSCAVTPEMVEAGVAVLYWGEREASKEALAEEVFRAMMAASR